MKKKNIAHIGTCSAILALLFGAGALSLRTNAALRGDINEDGKINANDYIALRRALLAGESLPSKTADVNGDGKINAADYIALRMHLLGLRPITQPEERFVRTPISLGCKYTVSGTIGESYQDTYGSELTDGSYAISATYFDTEYVGFQRDNADAAITVDLGSTRDGINGFEFSFLSTNSAGIMPPASVSVAVSADGKAWTSLGSMKLNTSPIMAADKATLDLNTAVAARYVKFSFTHRASWVFVDEVSVYATLPEGDVYTVSDGVRTAYNSGITEAEHNDALNSVKTTVPVSSELPLIPLTDGKSYKYTNASFPFSALTDTGKMLTDGNSGTTFRDGTWVAVDGSKETIITIDLGKTENDISAFSLSSCQRATSAVYLPTYVGFEVSTDGKSFAPVARLYSPTAHPDGTYSFSVENDYCVKARYVRFRVGTSGGRYTLISEVNASAHREDKTDVSVYPEVKLDTTDTGAWENPTSSVTNLLQGRSVQIDAYIPSVLDPEANTPVTSGILTDGKQASSNYCYDGTWFHFNSGIGRYLYFDMGHVSAMKYVSGGMLQKSSWGISVPREIKVYLSEDGINWYIAGKTGPKGTGDENRKTFRIDFDKTYKARFICFDIKELGKQLKKRGMLIVQDQVWNRVTVNREARKSTRYYIDEMHLLLKEEQTASYTIEIWKRFRKWGGMPTGITQNVKDLLSSREVENIFENSDYIYMLNQASGDRQILAKQLNISPHQLSYVTHSGEGEGLLFYGNIILPFVDRFPKDTELYRVLTTKPQEVSS